MPKFSGINRPYKAGEIEKTPQEKQKELDEKNESVLRQRWESRKTSGYETYQRTIKELDNIKSS